MDNKNTVSLSSGQKRLIALNALNKVYEIFMGTFIIVFIVNSARNSAVSVSIYNICYYALVMIGMLALARLTKRGGKYRTASYRIGLIFGIISMGVVAFGGMSGWLYLLSAIFGLYTAFLMAPYNAIIGETIPPPQMTRFANYDSSVGGVVRVLAPLLLGFAITHLSYEWTAVIIIPIMIASLFLSFGIDGGRQVEKTEKPQYKKFWQIARGNRHIMRTFTMEFMLGMTIYGAMATLTTMYAAYLFRTPANVGTISSVVAIFLIAMQFFIARFGGARHLAKFLKISSAVFFVVAALFFAMENQFVFILYNIAYAVMSKFLQTTCMMYMFSGLKICDIDGKYNTEYMLIREGFLNTGRFVGYGALLGIGLLGFENGLRYALFAMVLCIAVITVLVHRMNIEHGHKF